MIIHCDVFSYVNCPTVRTSLEPVPVGCRKLDVLGILELEVEAAAPALGVFGTLARSSGESLLSAVASC